MLRIFLCYRRAESSTLADYISSALTQDYGIEVLTDPRAIDPTSSTREQVRQTIERADAVVCLLGETTFGSSWVLEDIEHAHDLGKPMLPVFQQRYAAPSPIPNAHVEALLQLPGVRLLNDEVQVNEAIEQLAQMIAQYRRSSARPTASPGAVALIALAAIVGLLVISSRQSASLTPTAQSESQTAAPISQLSPSSGPTLLVTSTENAQTAVGDSTNAPTLTVPAAPSASMPIGPTQRVTQQCSGAGLAGNGEGTATYAAISGTPSATELLMPTPHSLQEALARARIPVIRNSDWTPITHDFDGVLMVLVPSGCFMMGSDNGGSDEQPVHQQCFEQPFWIDRTEVTLEDYERLGGRRGMANHYVGDNCPAESLTWFEARDFCLSRGGRLPSEREWEYASRGPAGLLYPWGNAWDEDSATWSRNTGGRTSIVGIRPGGASWVGAVDMSGNVWEWQSTLHRGYPYLADDGRESGDNIADDRVIRGGSWNNGNPASFRTVERQGLGPGHRFNYVGFRCARSS